MAISNPSETRNSDLLQQSEMVQACRLCRRYLHQSRPKGVIPLCLSIVRERCSRHWILEAFGEPLDTEPRAPCV
ncbi:Bgt-2787 [Blumeria graminis f. sp. tritici]|uniref:Bgt-2787 n=1 Tax=Blumeria graminis f. sp. tritici TaxID=62690 RepID=A0A9X9MLZ7_BLUGR|nr:Bgt-2787 [Blumeria graminis f. sp. tritici]